MKIVSIDLSTHQVGITIQDKDKITTLTITDILEQAKFQLLDLSLVQKAIHQLVSIIPYDSDYILIEWANIQGQPKYITFIAAVASGLMCAYRTAKVIPMCEARWLKLADKTFLPKRNTFPSGRANNKKWLRAIAEKLTNHKFKSQDEIDSYVMLKTFIYNKEKF